MDSKKEKRKSAIVSLLFFACVVVISFFGGIAAVDAVDAYAEQYGGNFLLYLLIFLFGVYLISFLQVVAHELGHLIFGLISGYRFCSFRVHSLMLLRRGGKLRFARQRIAGTAGQCLMAPPEPDENGRIPSVLFNLGGVIMNFFLSAVFAALYFVCRPHPIGLVFLLAAAIGLLMVLTNGIPLRLSMVDNDGRNALSLGKDPHALHAFYTQLKVNAEITSGVRLADMPEEWFTLAPDADTNNALIATIRVFACNRILDRHEFEQAEAAIRALLDEKSGCVALHKNLLICDLISLLIGSGREDEALSYLTKEQKNFMRLMRTFPSVIRTEYLIAKYITKDAVMTKKQAEAFARVSRRYPYPQDLITDRALMLLPETKKEEEGAGSTTV